MSTPGAETEQEKREKTQKEEREKLATVNKELESDISRWVSGLVVPVLLPVSTIISFYLQKWLGFNLSAGSLAAYLGTIVAGVGVTAYRWLAGRSEYEQALLEIVKLHEFGQR
jgi:hypothetical protein